MKFYNYCCVIIVNDEINPNEVFNFVEDEPNCILYKECNMSINTFVSSLTHNEIGDYFNTLNLNYFLFDIDSNSSFNLNENTLFKELTSNLNASEKTKDIIDLINHDDIFFLEEDYNIELMSKKEILLNINNILDKGYDKMDAYDKKYINKLYAKYNCEEKKC